MIICNQCIRTLTRLRAGDLLRAANIVFQLEYEHNTLAAAIVGDVSPLNRFHTPRGRRIWPPRTHRLRRKSVQANDHFMPSCFGKRVRTGAVAELFYEYPHHSYNHDTQRHDEQATSVERMNMLLLCRAIMTDLRRNETQSYRTHCSPNTPGITFDYRYDTIIMVSRVSRGSGYLVWEGVNVVHAYPEGST